MPLRSTVLCLSSNPELRETRRRVLLTQYDVVAVGSLAALRSQPATTPFSALVLCHTLGHEDLTSAIRYARVCWPGIKILVITAPHANPFRGEADAVLGGLAGPRALLDMLTQLLS